VAALVVGTMAAQSDPADARGHRLRRGRRAHRGREVFPFVFITIMCGAISGFHALVSSGTTPKMIDKESHARMIGYGSMLTKGWWSAGAHRRLPASTPPITSVSTSTSTSSPHSRSCCAENEKLSFIRSSPSELAEFERETHEQLRGRSGGAVSLAVGMAKIFSGVHEKLPHPGRLLVHFRDHVRGALHPDHRGTTGTPHRPVPGAGAGREGRPRCGQTCWLPGAVVSTALVVVGWGYFIWTGSIQTIWPISGSPTNSWQWSRLCVVTSALQNAGRARYAWVSLLPLAFVNHHPPAPPVPS
jgi:carbon starvation protein